MIDPSFQRVNILFVLSFEDDAVKRAHTGYFPLKAEIKGHNVMIDGQNVFHQPLENYLRTYDNIRKIATGQGDDTQLVVYQIIPILKDILT